ncbi:MAG: hypothetical protein HOW73_40290 [Polyangiaceae bacterium]|nr:hypothetical protein [Polyangiaceae bacterium]
MVAIERDNTERLGQLLREGEELVADWWVDGYPLTHIGDPDGLDEFVERAQTWRLTCLTLLSRLFGSEHPLSKAMADPVRQDGSGRINLHTLIPPLRAAMREVQDDGRKAPSRRAMKLPADLKGKIDFAIITIKEEEFEAVLARLPVEESVHGRRVYNLASVGTAAGDTYVVAIVRCIEQGTGEAQAVARDIIEELEPQWLLVVGIAGGVPATEFTLGDVVVSTRIFDFNVEAVVHDQPREFAVSGGPLAPSAAAVVANLRAMQLGSWSAASTIGCARPNVKKAKANFYGDLEWQKRVRASLKALDRQPLVVSGAIASSDRLMKDEELPRLWLKTTRQLLAIEMESAGVYRAARSRSPEVPTIAIRGISDIVGYKRDPGWTNYACHSAASFALAFLRARPVTPRGLLTLNAAPSTTSDWAGLVALGPGIIAPGSLIGADGATWQVQVSGAFILGDESVLTRFCDNFDSLAREDRFVAIEAHGEGRLLSRAPRWRRDARALRIDLEVEPLSRRTNVATMGRDLAIDMDKVPINVKLNQYVSGVERVPQCITRVLSICKGGWGVGSEIGSRVAELHERFGRERIASFIRLELIRIATTPTWNSLDKKEHFVFGFIDRVLDVGLLADPAAGWLRAQLQLQLHGVKLPWEGFVNICLSTHHLGPKPDFFKGVHGP